MYDPNGDLSQTSGNPLAETVQQIYTRGIGNVIYNDQPEDKSPSAQAGMDKDFHAHAKGSIA